MNIEQWVSCSFCLCLFCLLLYREALAYTKCSHSSLSIPTLLNKTDFGAFGKSKYSLFPNWELSTLVYVEKRSELRIIKVKTLSTFWSDPEFSDSEEPLKSWYAIAKNADWANPQDVKNQFGTASIVKDNRVVFNIAGNKYRLVVKFNYEYKVGYIRFVGTHKQYDAVDAETI